MRPIFLESGFAFRQVKGGTAYWGGTILREQFQENDRALKGLTLCELKTN